VAGTIGYLATIGGALVFIWKVGKQIKDVAEGQKCMLRSEIMNIYYRHCDEEVPTLREFERKNLDALYAAYERLHGNTFVSDIYKEMRRWHVSS
jgi:hypothetical protein